MKTLKLLFLSTLLVIITTSASCGSCASSKNNKTNKTFTVQNFTSIQANIVGHIIFTQSNKASLKVEGSQAMIDQLKIKEKNGLLTLSNQKNLQKTRGSLTLYISAPTIEKIKNTGVGQFTMQGTINGNSLEIVTKGVGDFEATQLQYKKIKATTEGVGNIVLEGAAELIELQAKGVGNIDAKKLESKNVIAKQQGVGNIVCYASESIDAHTAGMGNIIYYGDPKVEDFVANGKGKIKKK